MARTKKNQPMGKGSYTAGWRGAKSLVKCWWKGQRRSTKMALAMGEEPNPTKTRNSVRWINS